MGEIIVRKVRGMNWKAKIALVLMFTVIFSTFMYQGWYKPKASDATGTTNGRVVYGAGTTTPQNSAFTASSNTYAAGGASVTGATPSFMVNRSANTRNENMAAYVTTAGQLYVMRYNGTTWTNEWNVAVGGNGVNGRRFDIAYEEASGRAMVVYSTNAAGSAGNEMAYRIWDGATWTAAANISSARLTGAQGVGSIKLAARPGSNEIALMAQDTGTGAAANTGVLTAFIWNGTAWGDEPTIALNTAMPTTAANPGLIQYDNFGLAYESLSGHLMLVWAQQGASINQYITHSDASGWDAAVGTMPGTQRAMCQVYVVANPRTDQILAVMPRSANAAIYGYIWDGSSWNAQTSLGITMTAVATPNKHWVTGQWLNVAGTEYAVAVAQTSTAGTIGYNRYTGTTWGTAATLTGVGATNALSWVDSDYDTITPDTLMLTGSYLNGTNILLARRLVITAGPTLTWTTPTGSPMGSALTNVTSQNFSFAYSRLDTTPPVTSGVTIDSPVYTTFVGSPFTFHGDLTDNESGITSCQVCVKSGAECTSADTWIAGTLSGTGPYTCTATNVSTYSNGGAIASGNIVYVDVRGTSTGGQNVNGGTSAFKTMDKTAPTDGATFTITPGTDQNVLAWAAASDANSGLRTGSIYDLRSLPGTTPPTCSTGTSIYTGDLLTYTHSVTPYTGGYSYRVCAYDNVNMASTGKTGTGLPLWGSTVASCTRCHAYPPTAGARNNPEGAVVGSHDVHTNVCSTCHVAPGGTDYAHRTGNIQMKTTATGISGGFYDKAGTGIFASPADETFAQTNTPVTATCKNISCHGGAGTSTPQWGVGTAGCVDCHTIAVASPTAQGLGGPTTRSAVFGEFGRAYGHKKLGRGAVTNSDCIVCHLEGNFSTQHTSSYHMDGYIDLRDPDGAGETEITNISGVTYRFVQFSTSYAVGSRTSTGHTANNTDNILTQKFCLACHDSLGATNPTARTTYGTPTQYMPFGGVNLGANYTVANGAAAAGGVIDVKSQFALTNSSRHPVLGPRNKDFATPAHFVAPYNNFTRVGTSGTLTNGVVLNCFDCHNRPTTPLTTRTVTAHGDDVTLRGLATISGTPAAGNSATLCLVCHTSNWTSGNDSHGAGSAFSGSTGRTEKDVFLQYGCNMCHSSGYNVAAVRPVRAMDVHGVNTLPPTGQTLQGYWLAAGKPYAFIRNRNFLADHAPRLVGGTAPVTASSCNMAGSDGNGVCSNQGNQTYTVGGTY